LLALLGGLVAAPGPLRAQPARQASVEHLDLAIDLLADGTLRVDQSEQTRYTGTYQRDGRDIPFRGIGSLTEVQVQEADRRYRQGYNEPFTFSAARIGDLVRVDWWFPPVTDAVRATVLSYRVSGALRPSGEAAELSWPAIPDNRGAAIESAVVTLRLPPGSAAAALQAEAYVGERAVRPEVVAERELRVAVGSLAADESLVLRVRLPAGVVAVPTGPLQALYELRAAYPETVRPLLEAGLLLLGGLVLAVGLARLLGFWPGGRPSAAPARSPEAAGHPPGPRSPALAGWLADGRLVGRAVAATLVDLAGRGIVSVLPGSGGNEVRLAAQGSRRLGLEAHERTVLTALFPTGDTLLAAAAGRWQQQQTLFADQVRACAERQGLWIETSALQASRARLQAGLGLAACLALGLLAGLLLQPWLGFAWAPFAAGGLVCLAALLLAGRNSKLTPRGRRESAGWRAYARGLADRPEALTTETSVDGSYRQIAYALALGLAEEQLARLGASTVPAEAGSLSRVAERGAGAAPGELGASELARAALRAFVDRDRPGGLD
jgi:hypothetical protein